MKTKCKLKINVTFGNLKKYKEIESSIYDLIFSTQDTLEAFVNKNSKHFQKVTSESISCTLHFCGRKKIKKLNKDYRSKNYMTDVLSFPVHENLRHGLDFFCPEISLGDIFICLDYIISNNLNMKNSILEFFVHGFLHLFDFDHEISDYEEKIMFGYQAKLLEKIKKESLCQKIYL